jgi:hypothetical protein
LLFAYQYVTNSKSWNADKQQLKNDNKGDRRSKNDRVVAKKGCVKIQIKNVLKNFLRLILRKFRKTGVSLKTLGNKLTHFLYPSRKTLFLVFAIVLITLISSFLTTLWLSSSDGSNDDNPSGDTPNDEYDRTVSTTGKINVQGLEIFGGDIKYDPAHDTVYVDWGELTLGAYKNVKFYVKSNSNVDVELALNVTNWTPAGIDNYISIFWDYNGTLLSPTQEILVAVTLEVASGGDFIDFLVENEVTSFGFDITIFASAV